MSSSSSPWGRHVRGVEFTCGCEAGQRHSKRGRVGVQGCSWGHQACRLRSARRSANCSTQHCCSSPPPAPWWQLPSHGPHSYNRGAAPRAIACSQLTTTSFLVALLPCSEARQPYSAARRATALPSCLPKGPNTCRREGGMQAGAALSMQERTRPATVLAKGPNTWQQHSKRGVLDEKCGERGEKAAAAEHACWRGGRMRAQRQGAPQGKNKHHLQPISHPTARHTCMSPC